MSYIDCHVLQVPSSVAGRSEECWPDLLVLCRHPKPFPPSCFPSPRPQLQSPGAAAGIREGAEELGVYGRVAQALCLAAQLSEEVRRSESGGWHPARIIGWGEHHCLR